MGQRQGRRLHDPKGREANTLKAEEADGRAYANLEDSRHRLGAFIKDVYNANRLHSALGDMSPIASEAEFRKTPDRDTQLLTALSPN